MADRKMIRIQLVGSPICRQERQKKIIRALGLTKMNMIVVRPDDASFRGMVLKVPHLLRIVE